MANENRHMDIIEMDAASTRGIDDIKELIEHTKYQPSSARYKIFIIDEVHMLTNQAFNALLKTLEEPPDFVKFILATTDPLKLPATILSRTQHFRFKKIPEEMIYHHLEYILGKESIEFESDALKIIARSGAGSLRDALTLLDQAIVYSKNFVDVATVTDMLGIIDPSTIENLIEIIIQKDQDKLIDFLNFASEYEAEMVLDELTLYLKDALFSKNKQLKPLIIERFFRAIGESKELLKNGAEGDFVLSLTLFKMVESLELKEIDTLIKNLEKELKDISFDDVASTSQAPEKPVEKLAPQPQEPKEEAAPLDGQTTTTEEVAEEEVVNIGEEDIIESSTKEEVADEIPAVDYSQKYKKLIVKLYDRDYALGECFENFIEFESFEDDTLHLASCADEEHRKILRNGYAIVKLFVQELFGEHAKIVNKQKEAIKKKIESEPVEEQKEEPKEEPKREVPIQDHPVVQEAISLFEAQKIRIIKKG
jgi:DNA polymerase-3 subunit gamma/tau